MEFAKSRLDRVTEQQFLAGIGLLLKHAEAYNIAARPVLITESWRDGLGAMPGALWERFLPILLANWRDTFRLPPPGALWDIARETFAEWVDATNKLELALSKLPRNQDQSPRMSDAELDELMGRTKAVLAQATADFRDRGRIGLKGRIS